MSSNGLNKIFERNKLQINAWISSNPQPQINEKKTIKLKERNHINHK